MERDRGVVGEVKIPDRELQNIPTHSRYCYRMYINMWFLFYFVRS